MPDVPVPPPTIRSLLERIAVAITPVAHRFEQPLQWEIDVHDNAVAALVLVQEAITRLETMKPLRCRYVSIGSEACSVSPGYPREHWCYACDHREHREVALAALEGNT